MSWAQKSPLLDTPIWHLLCSSVARAESLMQVGQWQGISPPHDQTPSAGKLEKFLSAPISYAWDCALGLAGLECSSLKNMEDRDGRNFPELALDTVHPPELCAVENRQSERSVPQPSPNNQPGFQEPKPVSSNAISVKLEYCRAHVKL